MSDSLLSSDGPINVAAGDYQHYQVEVTPMHNGTPCNSKETSPLDNGPGGDSLPSLPLLSMQRSLLSGGAPPNAYIKPEATAPPLVHLPLYTTGGGGGGGQYCRQHAPTSIATASPTFSDISSILLTQDNVKKHHGPLPPLNEIGHTSQLTEDPHVPASIYGNQSLNFVLSPPPAAVHQLGMKRSYSSSPLSDMTDINALMHPSPNYTSQPLAFTFTAPHVQHPNIQHVPVVQGPPNGGTLPSIPAQQYTIKERKMSIEQSQDFTNGTFDTTITNKVTFREQQPPPLLHHQEPMEVLSPTAVSKATGNILHVNSPSNSLSTEISTEEPVSCLWESCTQQQMSISELVSHIEKCHIEKGAMEEYICLWRNCPRNRKPFNARYKLVIHMRIHSGEKPNKCTHPGCTKAFSRLENLKIHMRTHTGEKPYACQFPSCDKSFSNSSDRSKHQKTHYEQKPYACTHPGCDKRYTDPSSLRKHSRTHSIKKVRGNELTDCLQIQSLPKPHPQAQAPPTKKQTKKKQTKPDLEPHPLLIHYTPTHSYPNVPPYSDQSLYSDPPPLYSALPLYDHTHQPLPPSQYNFIPPVPAGQYVPRPVIKPHLQLSVNGYSHMYNTGGVPLTHYPTHPPPRYEDEPIKYSLPGQQRPHPLQPINDYSVAPPLDPPTSRMYDNGIATSTTGEYF